MVKSWSLNNSPSYEASPFICRSSSLKKKNSNRSSQRNDDGLKLNRLLYHNMFRMLITDLGLTNNKINKNSVNFCTTAVARN